MCVCAWVCVCVCVCVCGGTPRSFHLLLLVKGLCIMMATRTEDVSSEAGDGGDDNHAGRHSSGGIGEMG